MSQATQGAFLRSALLLLIMVAQLLIPLLHGHFGTPNQAGLHVHAAPSRMVEAAWHSAAAPALSADLHEHQALAGDEPFEVDVQSALQPLDQLPQPLLAVVGLALLTLGLRAARMRCVALRPTPRREPERLSPRWRGRVIRPSPAQAPPQFS
ncbi:MAG: hypothetical protein JSS01_13935 [Proteobacteria bacterium]|nr:hypothetical protein [Pseudomonadota bacterium]